MGIPREQFEQMVKRNPALCGQQPPAQPQVPNIAADFTFKQSTDEAKLNKTERARLFYLRSRGLYVGIQDVTLKLGDDCRFTPDFNYIENGRMIFEDVKGFQRDDALVKIKVAARKFRWADFLIVKKSPTGWDVMNIKP